MSCFPSSELSIDPARPLAGRFEVLRCLGVGSLGAVYLVSDLEEPNRLLALKTLIPSAAENKQSIERFRHEVETCRAIEHVNVIQVEEYFETPDLVAYTMNYHVGGDLNKLIKRDRVPDMPNIIRMLAELCEGLAAIHDRGVIHRDLKPENILLTELKQVRIADFGVCKMNDKPCFTSPGGVVGTIDYQSPEYLEHNISSAKGDIYSLGVVAYQLVTGQLPFEAETVYRAIERKMNSEPIAPRTLNSRCPAELSAWILSAMQRDPEKREGSVVKLREALRPLQERFPAFISGSDIVLANDRVLRLMKLSEMEQAQVAQRKGFFARLRERMGRSRPELPLLKAMLRTPASVLALES